MHKESKQPPDVVHGYGLAAEYHEKQKSTMITHYHQIVFFSPAASEPKGKAKQKINKKGDIAATTERRKTPPRNNISRQSLVTCHIALLLPSENKREKGEEFSEATNFNNEIR